VTGDADAQEHFPDPRGDVVAVFADEPAFEPARERLEQAGFGRDQYEVLHGEADLARIDTTSEAHGWMGRLFRRLQDVVTDESEHARRYERWLREGRCIVGVVVGDDQAAKQHAAEALRGPEVEFLAYYAANHIEDLATND
jgi:hypothetical protein